MRIQAINNINFSALYLVKGDYSKEQKNVIRQIKDTLNKPSAEFNNWSATDYYKLVKGFDFFIENGVKSPNSVRLSGKWGVKYFGKGANRVEIYRDMFNIGTYSKNQPFRTDDIKTGLKNKELTGKILNTALLLLAGTFFVLGIAMASGEAQRAKNAAKPLIENVDSLSNRVKSALSDTTKVFSPIKK